jgi:hypothetical protein
VQTGQPHRAGTAIERGRLRVRGRSGHVYGRRRGSLAVTTELSHGLSDHAADARGPEPATDVAESDGRITKGRPPGPFDPGHANSSAGVRNRLVQFVGTPSNGHKL